MNGIYLLIKLNKSSKNDNCYQIEFGPSSDFNRNLNNNNSNNNYNNETNENEDADNSRVDDDNFICYQNKDELNGSFINKKYNHNHNNNNCIKNSKNNHISNSNSNYKIFNEIENF